MITREPAGGECDFTIEALPVALLDEPLDYLFADHYRQRCVATALRRFAETGSAARREADMVIAYLDHDLPLHHEDEDLDLFPAVRRRAHLEDDLGVVLARLGEEHRQAKPTIREIVGMLAVRLADDPVPLRRTARQTILAYARSEQRHIAIENSVVLAIARRRLVKRDLTAMSRTMKARRGGVVP